MPKKTLLFTLVCALATPLLSYAGVINGDFETGDLTGWTLAGFGQAIGAGVGITPTQGSYQGYIETTGNLTDTAPVVAASLGISGPAIAAFGAGTPVNGTAISQDVTVSAGDTVSFDWNFVTAELSEPPTYNDFGFFTISGLAFLLASRNSSTYNTVSPPAGYEGQTGWATQSYTFPSAGTYTIGFGVFNVGDAGYDSALLLDSVVIPTPEPPSIVLLALGLLAGFLRCWRYPIAGRSNVPT
jgi:hypothetical protein